MGMFKGQGHIVDPVSSWFTSFLFHINQINNSWDTAISKFYLEKSGVKVMIKMKCQGHIVDPVSNQCTSFLFYVNHATHP